MNEPKYDSLYRVRDAMDALVEAEEDYCAADTAKAHREADALLCEALRQCREYPYEGPHVIDQIIEGFTKLNKWYA